MDNKETGNRYAMVKNNIKNINMFPIIIMAISFIFGAAAGWLIKGERNLFFTSYVPVLATLLTAYFAAHRIIPTYQI